MREIIEIVAASAVIGVPVLAIWALASRREGTRRLLSHPASIFVLFPIAGTIAGIALCQVLLAISPTFRDADAEVRNGRRAFDECVGRERLEVCRENAFRRREEFLRRTGHL